MCLKRIIKLHFEPECRGAIHIGRFYKKREDMETLRPAVGRNSTLTDEARAFILFLPLSNIYCSPTPARWKFRKVLDFCKKVR